MIKALFLTNPEIKRNKEMLHIGWIDYSKDHRDRVMRVLEMFTSPGAVDELGISVVRDAFSDRLFPGTSTLLTRAKYYLIVPWIMQELEEREFSPTQFRDNLHEQEARMSKVLLECGESAGVIGQRAGGDLKRKPSETYWNGLRTFGIFRDPRMSIANYHQAAGKVHAYNRARKAALLREEQSSTDDSDADAPERYQPFWEIIDPPEDWRSQMTFAMTADQARFLRNKIITSRYSKKSLLAYLLTDGLHLINPETEFDDLSPLDLPFDIRHDYTLAQQFAFLVSGAHLRYNIIFFNSNEQLEHAEAIQQEWIDWKRKVAEFDFTQWHTRSMLGEMGINPGQHAYHFVLKWIDQYAQHLATVREEDIDEFIRQREIRLKGSKRAKIGNTPQYQKDWIGISYLEYRWPYARQIILDIAKGLGIDATART
ncbi:MAG: DUF6361 family protein [Armatimonadota bacterium]